MPKAVLPPLARSLLIGLGVVAVVAVYAYGVQVTQVNLAETQKPDRLVQLTRIIRAIAQPELLEFETVEQVARTPVFVPCPANAAATPALDSSQPYLTLSPQCAADGESIRVEGFNFQPGAKGPVDFIPPSGVRLQVGSVQADAQGYFSIQIHLPSQRVSTEAQSIQVILRSNVGWPHWTRNALDTWDKIIETVFLALLATTLGVVLAMPLSFLAAQNLMRPITRPMLPLALSALALPVGFYAGAALMQALGSVGLALSANVWLGLCFFVFSLLIAWRVRRWAISPKETVPPTQPRRLARWAVLLALAFLLVVNLGLLAALGPMGGRALTPYLGAFGFLGFFMATLSEAVWLLLPALGALAGGVGLAMLAGSAGGDLCQRLPIDAKKATGLIFAGLVGAVYCGLIGMLIGWLYELPDPRFYLWLPAGLGGALGLIGAIVIDPEWQLPVGMWVYTLVRTGLNALRAIEPLIMVIVFAVWVGLGPFAGTLALALHTIAALGKLYSEQVESILAGPLEAIQATGATRLQIIVYAVVPQILLPYISFTMYRWDINVRMSTIIGFAGGGGIGFLLQQNITLLQYRAAAVQMLAIALVVAGMDYVSTKLREKAL